MEQKVPLDQLLYVVLFKKQIHNYILHLNL